MGKNIYRYLAIAGILCSLLVPDFTHSASFEWNQTDWTGGASTTSAQHPGNQSGWNKFLSKDLNVGISTPGQVQISTIPGLITDTDFTGGIMDNVDTVGTGAAAYIKLTDYPLSLGTGKDLDLTVDGRTPSNSSDGLAHPRPVPAPTGLVLSAGASGSLTANYTYYYRVVAYTGKGESTPVKGNYTPSQSNKSIILSWNAVPCAEGYRIYGRGVRFEERSYGLLATVPSSQTSWEDTGALTPGISVSTTTTGGTLLSGYKYYKIAAYNENGETNFALAEAYISATGGTATITWTPVPWAQGYYIYGRPSSYNSTYGFLTATSATTWTDTGALTPDTMRVPVENNVSDGSYLVNSLKEYEDVSIMNCGSVSAAAGSQLPSPSNLKAEIYSGVNGPDGTFYYVATAVDPFGIETRRSSAASIAVSGTNAVRVSWNAVSGASGYRVYRSTSGSFSATSLVCSTTDTFCIDSAATPSSGAPPVNTSLLPTPSASVYSTGGLLGSGTYYYVLTTIDTAGYETTTGPQRSVSVTYTTGTASVTLSWSAVSEAKGYRIYRTVTSGLYNSPSLVCKIDNPSTLSCSDTLVNPSAGAPPRSYTHALAYGKLDFRVLGTLYSDSTSILHVNGQGYPGGAKVTTTNSAGLAGMGAGAGGHRGAGAGYGSNGSNNDSGTGNIGYAYGDNKITVPYPGSGGASGSTENYTGISGRGGAGGGTIKVFAGTINLQGGVTADGENGRDGVGGSYVHGGGGGSGGTVLLGGRNVSLSTVSTAGGTGGGPADSTRARYIQGGSGGDGRIRIVSDTPVSGNISPSPYMGNVGTFESRSFQLDTGGVTFTALRWTATVPVNSTLRFQIATNKDNATWTFVGPDGTTGSFYNVTGSGSGTIHSSNNGNRFLKYKVYMESRTTNPLDSPVVNDISVEYLYTPRYQKLESSYYNSNTTANSITRIRWSENISAESDVVFQLRTSSDGNTWSGWFGPRNTTFSAAAGVTTITVTSAAGFTAGNRVTLANSSNPAQEEVKKIVSISGNNVTLDSATAYSYSSGSILTNTYTDAGGGEIINTNHIDGTGDRWFQYRVFLFSNGTSGIPYLLENIVSYGNISAVYKPDGIIESNGDNVYGAAGSGGGGSYTKSTDPAVQVTYNLLVQNEGNAASVDDIFEILWNTPSDVSGNWSVVLNDGTQDFTSAMLPVRTVSIPVGGSRSYTLKVTPSANAPPGSKNVFVDIHSGSDYNKVDSVKAAVNVNIFYKADGVIDGNGNGVYDPNRTGGGGTATGRGNSGETVSYNLDIQNEGNVSDTYTLSLSEALPKDWKVFINDGTADYDITDTSKSFTTQSIPPPPDTGSTGSYTLKIIPAGSPGIRNVVVNVYSNNQNVYFDSVTATIEVNAVRKVDGIINGHGDSIYGATGSGSGGFTSQDIKGGTTGNVVIGIQNEGNVDDGFRISWTTPSGWSIVLADTLLDGSRLTCTSPCEVPAIFLGAWPKYSAPDKYKPGEVPSFTFEVKPPSSFTTGSRTLIFDISSTGDAAKIDSVKATINSSDTTAPAPVSLSTGSITATSVKVSWTAPGDNGTSGRAASYDLRYSTSPISSDAGFLQASKVRSCKSGESNLRSPKSAGNAESCTVSPLFADTNYYFALKTYDEVGNISLLSTCSSPSCPARTLTSGDTTRPATITDLSVTDTTVTRDPATLQETINVTLCWSAVADDGTDSSSGAATGYDLRYSTRSIVDDGATPASGQITFSNAKIATPSDGFSPPGSPGMRECYMVPVENKINTGGGVIDDRTRNTRFYFAIKALDEARNKSLLSNVAGGVTQLVPYAYNMVSVPYVPNPNTPSDVFGDDVGTPLYVYKWDSRGPENDQGCYDGEPEPYSANPARYTCIKLNSIKEGRGYFLWVPQVGVIPDVPSASTTPAVQNCVDDKGATFQCSVFSLQEGWNTVGAMADRETNFTSRDVNGNGLIEGAERGIYVRRTGPSGVDIATFQDAVTARNWIDNSVFAYNGINYTWEVCDQDKTGESQGTRCGLVMQPWKAYWLRLHVAGGATFELLMPR